MEVSAEIVREADVFLAAFMTGAFLLFVYDLLRIVRKILPHKMWLVGAEDLVFWIGGAVVLFAMMYRENSGYIRGFVIGGVLAGMLLYNLLFSARFVSVSVFLLEKLLFVASRPFVWTSRVLRRPLGFAGRKIKKVLRFFKKQLKKLCKVVRMVLCKF